MVSYLKGGVQEEYQDLQETGQAESNTGIEDHQHVPRGLKREREDGSDAQASDGPNLDSLDSDSAAPTGDPPADAGSGLAGDPAGALASFGAAVADGEPPVDNQERATMLEQV